MSGPPFDVRDSGFVGVYDDLPLWSAPCGFLLLDAVDLKPGTRALDVGCGTGFPLVELGERLGPGCEVHGVDPWAPAIDRAQDKIRRRQTGHVRAHLGRAEELPFPSAYFDLIVSNLGINNLDAPERVLAECRRVARDGAQLVVSTNLAGTMQEVYVVLERALADLGIADRASRIEELVASRKTPSDITALIAASGFEVVRTVRSSFSMRYLDGDALLGHSFIRLAFLDAWMGAVDADQRHAACSALLRRLNEEAERSRGLTVTVPIACFVARAAAGSGACRFDTRVDGSGQS
jgi:arsenite methyltransferase